MIAENILKNAKVLVTGGAGFIGSNLVDELLKLDCRVSVIDDLSSGREDNLEAALRHKQFTLIKGSICDLDLLKQSFTGVEFIFHLAAIASVNQSLKDPLRSHEVNLTGTLNVLMAARDASIKKIVFASSSAVYGDSQTTYKQEDQIPSPQSPYALTKLAAEHYCSIFGELYGISTICLRYFNVYGPRQAQQSDYAAVIPQFINLITKYKSPVIYGDGLQTRDFIFVKDVVRANLLAASSDANGVFNIGSGHAVSVNELTELLIKLTGNPGLRYRHTKERPGDIKHSVADIHKARQIGFSSRYSLRRGLMKTIQSISKDT
jgi:UDP-glucose 4-epimerase